MLTTAQKKRLAKEARKLAMECVEGRAPLFGKYSEFHHDGSPNCASGHVAARANLPPHARKSDSWRYDAGARVARAWWGLATTNDNDEKHPALPWMLLEYADALEESARK